MMNMGPMDRQVAIPIQVGELPGTLNLPRGTQSLVVFAHGSGSSRLSPRNTYVAGELQRVGIGTLLFDLLTPVEDYDYDRRFDIPLLTERLLIATRWLRQRPETAPLALGYFGASTGSAAALSAAAVEGTAIRAVVSRGGRPDLAMDDLPRVQAATLLIVGGDDPAVRQMNEDALLRLGGERALEIVPGATHLFEEPGALEEVARLASAWFQRYLTAGRADLAA